MPGAAYGTILVECEQAQLGTPADGAATGPVPGPVPPNGPSLSGLVVRGCPMNVRGRAAADVTPPPAEPACCFPPKAASPAPATAPAGPPVTKPVTPPRMVFPRKPRKLISGLRGEPHECGH